MINSLKNIKVKLWNFLSYLYLQELLNLIALMFKFSKKNNCVDLAETTLSIIGHDITDEILFPSAQKIKWLRPSEMCENPEFITKHNHFSVIKGESEGKSLLAGVSILIQDSYLFSKVVPEFNCFEGNSGMFVFR